MDPRIEQLVAMLNGTDLSSLTLAATEKAADRLLCSSLSSLPKVPLQRTVGIDGSVRNPDDARLVGDEQLGTIRVAIEYKLYRNRRTGAGEMDRALGQSIAYAESFDAVLFFVVFMAKPEHSVPAHWLDRSSPLRVGHVSPGVPIYFGARPRDWSDSFAGLFRA